VNQNGVFFPTCYSLAGEMLAAGDLEGPDIKGFGSIVAATGHAVVWTYVAVQTHRFPRTIKVAYDVERCCLYFRAGMTRVECDLSLGEIENFSSTRSPHTAKKRVYWNGLSYQFGAHNM